MGKMPERQSDDGETGRDISRPYDAGVVVRAMLLFVGLLAVLGGFYWSHRPFGIEPGSVPPIVLTVGGALLDLLTVALLFLTGGMVGRVLLARLLSAAGQQRTPYKARPVIQSDPASRTDDSAAHGNVSPASEAPLVGLRPSLAEGLNPRRSGQPTTSAISDTPYNVPSVVNLSRLEWIALRTGIGLGAMSLAAALLGLVGLFQPLILWGVLLVLAVIFRRALIATIRDWIGVLGAIRTGSAWERFALVLTGVMLVMALLYGLAPPTHWDSLTYHLLAPTRYLREGRISAQPDVFYLGFSQNVEMLYSYTVGLFGRLTAAAPVHFGVGLLALIGVAGLVRRYAGRWAGWTAALLLLSSYNLWALFGWAYVDLATLLYGTLALIALTSWASSVVGTGYIPSVPASLTTSASPSVSRRWLIVLGVIVGLAAGVKYNAGALGLAVGVYVLLTEPKRVVQNGVIVVGAALIVFLPWAIKGLALYGNPVYPFAFGGLEWDAGRTAAFNFPAFSFSGRGWLAHLPFLPVAATIFGRDNADGYGFTLGAWLLTTFAALPLLWRWVDARERVLARAALIFIGVLWAFWVVAGLFSGVGIQTRLMIMAFPAFAAAGALAFAALWRFPEKPVMVGFIVRMAFAVTMILTLLDAVTTFVRDQPARYLFGQTSFDEYLYQNTGAYYNALQNLPAGSQVRLMFEPRSVYCPESVRCLPDSLLDHWLRPSLDGATPDEVFAAYRAGGDDYLLVFSELYGQYLDVSRDRALDEQFMATIGDHMQQVWTDDIRYTLYGWKNE